MACPRCHGELRPEGDDLKCAECEGRYRVEDGIPILLDSKEEGAGRAAGYYADPAAVERYYDKRVNSMRRAHYGIEHFPTGGVLVDVGCGPGILTMVSANRGSLAIGMDLSLSMVRFARDKARELNLTGAFFLVGDSQRLPFRSATADLVTNYANLAHVPSPRRCIEEMTRIVAPKGRIIVQSINHFAIPLLYLNRENLGLYRRSFGAIGLCLRRGGRLRDEDCRLQAGRGPEDFSDFDPESDMDTNNVVSFHVRRMCGEHLEVLNYETFPNYRGWHHLLAPDLRLIKQRRGVPHRLKDTLWRLADKVPGLRHMGTDLFLVCRPRAQSRVQDP